MTRIGKHDRSGNDSAHSSGSPSQRRRSSEPATPSPPPIVAVDPDGKPFDPFAAPQGPPSSSRSPSPRLHPESAQGLYPGRPTKTLPPLSPLEQFARAPSPKGEAKTEQALIALLEDAYGFSPAQAEHLARSSGYAAADAKARPRLLAQVAKFCEVGPESPHETRTQRSGAEALEQLGLKSDDTNATKQIFEGLDRVVAAFARGTTFALPRALKAALMRNIARMSDAQLDMLEAIDVSVRQGAELQLPEHTPGTPAEDACVDKLLQLYQDVADKLLALSPAERTSYHLRLTQTLAPFAGYIDDLSDIALALMHIAVSDERSWAQKAAFFRAISDIEWLLPVTEFPRHPVGLAILPITGFDDAKKSVALLERAARAWQQSARNAQLRQATQEAPLLLLEEGHIAHETELRALVQAGDLRSLHFNNNVSPRERRIAHQGYAALLQHALPNKHIVRDYTTYMSAVNRGSLASLVLEAKQLPVHARNPTMQFAVALAVCGLPQGTLDDYRALLVGTQPEFFVERLPDEAAVRNYLLDPLAKRSKTPTGERPPWLKALDVRLRLYPRSPVDQA